MGDSPTRDVQFVAGEVRHVVEAAADTWARAATLCGIAAPTDGWLGADQALPTCRRCTAVATRRRRVGMGW